MFASQFWPTVGFKYTKNTVINQTNVWTEIYSYLLGSSNSHEYLGWSIPKIVYLNNHSRQYTKEIKTEIFDIFILYERWKVKNGFYDLMDVVNYQLNQFKYGRYLGKTIHYLMIDEVQDLPHAVLLLLAKITEQGLFFSGDTA